MTKLGLPEDQTSITFWRSLLYFNFYRIAVSGLLLGAGVWWSELRPLGMQYGGISDWIVRLYFLIAIGFLVIQTNWRPRFNLLLTIEVFVDVGIFTLLMHLNGGIQSGFSYMILVVLAGAGLVSHGRLTLFFAAVASVFVLSEHLYSMAQEKSDISSLTFAATICTSFFGTAVLAHLLSKRVVASEALAKVRGDQLDAQFKINAQVIHDMEDGLLVVDSFGTVLQYNPSVIRLLKKGIPRSAQLGDLSPTIERAYFSWRNRKKLLGDSASPPGSASLEVSRVRFVATGNDDNALIYLEDAARLRAEAQQIKLAALGRLTANMAHEIRNPLAAISHAAELLGEDSEGAVTQKLSRIITDNSERLNRIVSDVLELGRRDKAKAEPIRLDQFLEELKEEWAILFPEFKGWLTVEYETELVVHFDRSHLHRILTNLISNSFRYASGVPGCVGIIAEPKASSVWVDVFDDGPGICEAERSRIFEPFFTTHNQGTGLGLYIARELSIANYGNLELLPGDRGTRFRLTITRSLN